MSESAIEAAVAGATSPVTHLRRGMSLRNVVSTSTGLAFAAIEYPAIASLLGYTDPAYAWVAVLSAGVFAFVAWGFFGELNGMYPSAATIRLFMNKALNDQVSLTVTFAYLSTITLVMGADAYIVGNVLTHVLNQPGWVAIIYIALLLALAAGANMRGVTVAASLQDVAVYTVIAVTIVIAVIALSHPSTAAAHHYQVLHQSQHNLGGFISAVLVGIFLFSAFEWVITNSEEVIKPRHVPIGMVIALCTLAVTIVLVATAMGRLLGSGDIDSPYPQLFLGQAAAGATGFAVMAAITGVTAINTFNGGFITASRFMYALAREGSLPKVFARLNDRLVPYVPVLLLAGASLAVAVVVQVGGTRAVNVLVEVGAVFEAMIYMMAGLCVLMLRRREPYRERPFSLPVANVLGWGGVGAFALLTAFAAVTVGPDVNGLPLVLTLAALYASWWYVTRVLPGIRRKAQTAPRRRPTRRPVEAAEAAADVASLDVAATAVRPRLAGVSASRGSAGAPPPGAPPAYGPAPGGYSRTDRLLAGLMVVQLLAAVALGWLLVSGLRNGNSAKPTYVAIGATPAASPSTVPSPSASAGTPGSTGQTKTTTTTTGGGSTAANAVIAAGAPIKIGTIVTQTGAINFTASAQGTKAYIDMINRQGGVNGHQIQLELLDDQLDAARGNSEVQQLINDNVFSFVAFQAPITENGLVPTVEKAQMPVVGAYGEYEEYHTAYVFPFTADYPHYGYEMARYLALLGSKTPALVFITNNNNNADNSIKAGATDGFKAHGVTLQSGNIFVKQPTDATYDDVASQMRLNNVDGMITILDPTAYIRFQQSLNRLSYHPIHVGDPLLADKSVVNDPQVGASINGDYVASDLAFSDSGTPGMSAYVNAVNQDFGSQAQVNWLGEVGWFDAKAFVDGVRSLGTTITRQRLMDALNGGVANPTDFMAPFNYSGGPKLHDWNRCLQLGKIVNARVEPAQGYNCDNESTFAGT